MDWSAFFFGTVLGSVLGYLAKTLLEHHLSKERSALDRQAVGAREFRAKVNEALALFQRPEENWSGNNRTANAMRNFVSAIDLATKDYAGLCSAKTEFLSKWQETKDYCSTTLPRAMTSNSLSYSQDAKTTFLKHVDELLSHADA